MDLHRILKANEGSLSSADRRQDLWQTCHEADSGECHVNATEMSRELKMHARKSGADVVGIADLSKLKPLRQAYEEMPPGDWRSGVVFGVRMPSSVIAGIRPDDPGRLYAYEYGVVSEILDRIAFDLVVLLEDMGYPALPVPSRGWAPPQLASLLALARAAGLGALGKNQLLLREGFGCRLRFGAVLTSVPLAYDSELNQDPCGSCRACIDACPVRAIKETPYSGTDIRPDAVDKDACWNYTKKWLETPGYGRSICGVCIKVCRGPFK